jgi:WD40-like Beta Propeller Repeat
MLATTLVALAGARPAQAAFPDEALPVNHGPIAFEKDGDIWAVTRMRLANLTPNTPDSNEVGPAVSPDDRHVTFASDRDGHFVHYVADVFTGDVQWSPTTR